MNMYVGNLNYRVKEGDLEQAMAAYGVVTSVKVIKDRETGKSKGFAFVEMENDAEAAQAMNELNGSEFMDSFIKIMVHFIKFGRICTLKAVNRLFTIPDNKNCARQGIFITSLSGKELLCQCPDNSPLVWGGILRFVN